MRQQHIEELQAVIRQLHGVESTHSHTVPIKEMFQGQTVWDGDVEVFHLHGHPMATKAYAWLHETGNPERPIKHITVLHIPPVVSPQSAVQIAIAGEYRERN